MLKMEQVFMKKEISTFWGESGCAGKLTKSPYGQLFFLVINCVFESKFFLKVKNYTLIPTN